MTLCGAACVGAGAGPLAVGNCFTAGCFIGTTGFGPGGVTVAAGVDAPDEVPEAIAAAKDAGSFFAASSLEGFAAAGFGTDGAGAGADLAVDAAEAAPCDAAALAATGAFATRFFTIRTAVSTFARLPLTYTTRGSFGPIDS